MKALAGDWKQDTPVIIKRTFSGRPRAMILMKGWFSKDIIRMDQIENLEVVTEENKTSVLGKAAWGAAGGLLLGGVGLLAGVLGGGNSKQLLLAVEFKDGRKTLLECTSKEYKEIFATQFGK